MIYKIKNFISFIWKIRLKIENFAWLKRKIEQKVIF